MVELGITKYMNILAIDTSADETSVAITNGFRVLSSTIASQIRSHNVWGGIVPSIAKLAHVERIDGVVANTLRIAKSKKRIADTNDINAVAVTYGPGLSIALEVGIRKAKELATAWSVPLIAVNHMEGHLYSPFVQNSKGNPPRTASFPFLSLLISGGHTQIVLAKDNGVYEILGETVDDAAGEALDKAAKMLGLGYPGGPIIERLAREAGNSDTYHFPRPMMREESANMSFSGLKTHMFYFLKGEKGVQVDISSDLRNLASSFQEAVFDSVLHKFEKGVIRSGVKVWAVGGGVSANKRLRRRLRALAKTHHAQVYFPPYPYLCGDNAAMIGVAAHLMASRGDYVSDIDSLDRVPRARLGQELSV